MSTCSGVCGITISCPDGCGVFCTSDCSDCTQWCEPTTVEEGVADDAIPLDAKRTIAIGDQPSQHLIGPEIESSAETAPRHGLADEFTICVTDVSPARLARLLSAVLREADALAHVDEGPVSLSARAPLRELLGRLSLRAGRSAA